MYMNMYMNLYLPTRVCISHLCISETCQDYLRRKHMRHRYMHVHTRTITHMKHTRTISDTGTCAIATCMVPPAPSASISSAQSRYVLNLVQSTQFSLFQVAYSVQFSLQGLAQSTQFRLVQGVFHGASRVLCRYTLDTRQIHVRYTLDTRQVHFNNLCGNWPPPSVCNQGMYFL